MLNVPAVEGNLLSKLVQMFPGAYKPRSLTSTPTRTAVYPQKRSLSDSEHRAAIEIDIDIPLYICSIVCCIHIISSHYYVLYMHVMKYLDDI